MTHSKCTLGNVITIKMMHIRICKLWACYCQNLEATYIRLQAILWKRCSFSLAFCFPVECHICEGIRKNPEELIGFRGQCNKLSKKELWLRQGDNRSMGITKWNQCLSVNHHCSHEIHLATLANTEVGKLMQKNAEANKFISRPGLEFYKIWLSKISQF